MQLIRKSKNYLIKILNNLIKTLGGKPDNKGDTIYALPYKSNINKIEEKEIKIESIVPYNNYDNNTIRIVSSYIKSIKIKKK
jgi:hypothetical protein|nr:MAG TPA: hypothetical protein [Bacteriophage sp.]